MIVNHNTWDKRILGNRLITGLVMKKLLLLLFLSLGLIGNSWSQRITVCDEEMSNETFLGDYSYSPGRITITSLPSHGPVLIKTYLSFENICKWNNGNTRIKGQYINGKREGKWIWWNEDGQRTSDINYKSGFKLSSETKYTYYYTGLIKSEINYKDDKLGGKYHSWHENGQKWWEGNYKDRVPDGIWTSWNENGERTNVGSFIDGTGNFSIYKNNKNKFELSYIDGAGKETTWDDNGEIKFERKYIKGEEIGEGGSIITRFDNDQLKSEVNWKDGKLDGKQTRWYENGQIKSVGNFKEGVGKETSWDKNGQKKSEANWKDGKLHGKRTWWHENGQIEREEIYQVNKLSGETKYSYYDNGQIESEINYRGGKLQGKYHAWYENGQKWFELNYIYGKNKGKATHWYESGQIKSEINY